MTHETSKEVHIIGGGTVFHIRPHLALSAPAYGSTAKKLKALVEAKDPHRKCHLHLTKMAGGDSLETNQDIQELLQQLTNDEKPKIIFMNAALCDFEGNVQSISGTRTRDLPSGKDQPRLKTSLGPQVVHISPAKKLLGEIRKERKDIFLIAFKTTAGASKDEQFEEGMALLKNNSCNLVLANDVHTRNNMILTPEMASYGNTTDRLEALMELVDITLSRSNNEFIRTKIISETPVPWEEAPPSLRKVVEHCVSRGAYKPFNGKSVGHFGYKFSDNIFFSSRRKQNYEESTGLDLAKVEFKKNGEIHAYGGKPSAGVRSQYELIKRYNQFDCVVHFHRSLKTKNDLKIQSQKYFECGSQQCGQNTANGVRLYLDGNIGAVMLDKHGPNILFHKSMNPDVVIGFIEYHFNLSEPTR